MKTPTLLVVCAALAGCGGSNAADIFRDPDAGAAAETASGDDTSLTPDGGDDEGPPPIDSSSPPKDTGTDTGLLPETPVVVCPEPGGKVFEGRCYFPLMPRNWFSARDVCATLKAHLVTITSKEEQAFVISVGMNDRWIGMARSEGTPIAVASYKWITGEPNVYTAWDPSEPNGSGSCVRLRNDGPWGDGACTQNLGAVCERE